MLPSPLDHRSSASSGPFQEGGKHLRRQACLAPALQQQKSERWPMCGMRANRWSGAVRRHPPVVIKFLRGVSPARGLSLHL